MEDKKGLALRDTNTKRRKEFNVAFCDTDWSFINEAEDVNIAYDSFIEKYVGIVCTCFLLIKWKEKGWLKITKPSISRGLSKSISQKNKL